MRLFATCQKIETAKSGQRAIAAFDSINVYRQLIRPGLLSAVLFSMAVAALTADDPPHWTRLLHAMLGTASLIAGATAFNQLLERRQDAQKLQSAGIGRNREWMRYFRHTPLWHSLGETFAERHAGQVPCGPWH